MESRACKLSLLLLVAVLLTSAESIGINYGRVANNLPSPARVVELLRTIPGADRVKIFDTDQGVIRAFANTNFKLMVAATNQEIATLGSSVSAAQNWVRQKITPVYPATKIEIIAVGNEVLSDKSLPWNLLVPAMWNLKGALDSFGWRDIKVTTPLAMDIMAESYPPSKGSLRNDGGLEYVFPPLLDFISRTDSLFFVNVYTFFSWQGNKGEIRLDYATFGTNQVVVRDDNGLGYTNLFDAMVDGVYAALNRAGYGNVKLAIGESGWPNGGEDGANVENARRYNSQLIARMNANRGTPRKPGFLQTYIFALFNENQKGGPEIERHFGLLYPNGAAVYPLQTVHRAPEDVLRLFPESNSTQLESSL